MCFGTSLLSRFLHWRCASSFEISSVSDTFVFSAESAPIHPFFMLPLLRERHRPSSKIAAHTLPYVSHLNVYRFPQCSAAPANLPANKSGSPTNTFSLCTGQRGRDSEYITLVWRLLGLNGHIIISFHRLFSFFKILGYSAIIYCD